MEDCKVDRGDTKSMPTSQSGHADDTTYTHDAVFGDITDEGPNYRNVGHFVRTV